MSDFLTETEGPGDTTILAPKPYLSGEGFAPGVGQAASQFAQTQADMFAGFLGQKGLVNSSFLPVLTERAFSSGLQQALGAFQQQQTLFAQWADTVNQMSFEAGPEDEPLSPLQAGLSGALSGAAFGGSIGGGAGAGIGAGIGALLGFMDEDLDLSLFASGAIMAQERQAIMTLARSLMGIGSKMQLDLVNDAVAQGDAGRQAALAGKIHEINMQLADDTNMMDSRLATSKVIQEGTKLGVPPKVAVDLYASINKVSEQVAAKKGMTAKDLWSMMNQRSQMQLRGIQAQEAALRIDERLQQQAAPVNAAVNTFTSAYQTAIERTGKEKPTFDDILDELEELELTAGKKGAPFKFKDIQPTFGRDVADERELAIEAARQLMDADPDLKDTTNYQTLAVTLLSTIDPEGSKKLAAEFGVERKEEEEEETAPPEAPTEEVPMPEDILEGFVGI